MTRALGPSPLFGFGPLICLDVVIVRHGRASSWWLPHSPRLRRGCGPAMDLQVQDEPSAAGPCSKSVIQTLIRWMCLSPVSTRSKQTPYALDVSRSRSLNSAALVARADDEGATSTCLRQASSSTYMTLAPFPPSSQYPWFPGLHRRSATKQQNQNHLQQEITQRPGSLRRFPRSETTPACEECYTT